MAMELTMPDSTSLEELLKTEAVRLDNCERDEPVPKLSSTIALLEDAAEAFKLVRSKTVEMIEGYTQLIEEFSENMRIAVERIATLERDLTIADARARENVPVLRKRPGAEGKSNAN
jgi:hypothetical protein